MFDFFKKKTTDKSVEPSDNQPHTESHPDDFYQQVLGSFKEEYSEAEIQAKQKNWQKFEEPVEQVVFNDFPEYFFAGFWMRLWAFVVDLLCITGITSIAIDWIFQLFNWEMSTAVFSAYGLLSLLIYLAYFTLLTKLNQGQTIGKMIFGIRVISFTEEELSWETVLIRETACRFILQAYPLFLLGYLPAAFTGKKQHTGDYFADTSVVTLNMIKAFNKQAQA